MERIITSFEGDLTGLEKAFDEAEKRAGEYVKATEGGIKAAGDLGKGLGDLEAKTKVLAATQRELGKASLDATKAIDGERKSTEALGKEQQKAAGSAEELAGATREVGKGEAQVGRLGGAFARLRNVFASAGRGIRGIVTTIRDGLGGARGEADKAGGAIGGIGDAARQAASRIPLVGRAISALSGPIGIATAAVAALASTFLRLDTVQDRLDQLRAGFSTFIDALSGNATISDTVAAIGRAIDRTKELDALNTRAIAEQVRVSELRAQAAELQRQSRNRTIAEEQRVALLERANQLLEEAAQIGIADNATRAEIAYRELIDTIILQNRNLSQEQREQLQQYTTLTAQAAEQIRSLDEQGINVDQKRFDAAAKASAQRIQEESEITLLRERNNNFIDALRETSSERERQRIEREDQERRRAFEREQQRIQQLDRLREQAATLSGDLERDQFRATLGDDTRARALFEVEVRGLDQLEAANKIFDEQVRLAAGRAKELERIERERQALLLAIRQDTNAKLDAVDRDFDQRAEQRREEALARITEAARDPLDVQASQIEARYDELLSLLGEFVTDEDELLALRNALNAKRNEELNAITRSGAEERQVILESIEAFTRQVAEGAADYLIGQQDQSRQAIEEINENYNDQIANLQRYAESEADIADERLRLQRERDAQIEQERKKAGKAFLRFLLDQLQRQLTVAITEVAITQTAKGGATGGVPGALAGAAQAAIIAAILNGLFSGLRGIIGAYHGEEYVGERGRPDLPGTRDTYLRRTHKGERIITADDNREHWDVLHAIHKGQYDKWYQDNVRKAAMAYASDWVANDTSMRGIARYLSSDTGQRAATSVMLAKYYDRNIVDAITRQQREQRRTNELLGMMVQGPPRRSIRAW